MFRAKVRTKDETKRVLAKAKMATIKNLGHAGGALRLTARRSIRKSKRSAQSGSPPHTRAGLLKKAIAFAIEQAQQTVVVGPQHSIVGDSGKAHEFGGVFRRERYPKRPFMGPALLKIKDRLPAFWANSVR